VSSLVSVVIPSYQMAPYLKLTLESLRRLQDPAGVGVEVVVLDDGSSDETPAVVAAAQSGLAELQCVRRARDQKSCRALARNLGAHASSGKYLLFLDAGVVVPPDLLDTLLRAWAQAEEDVLAISTLGLFAWQAYADVSGFRARFECLAPDALASTLDALGREPAWCDRRQSLFSFTRGELSCLPAPWLLAWTSALGVPRRLFEAVAGFDESFHSWGAEDCDFALRLYELGARFRGVSERSVLHVPHPTETNEAKAAQHLVNVRKLHQKRFGRESELLLVLQDPLAVNLLALRLDRAPLERLLPPWSPEMLDIAERLLAPDAAPSLVCVPQPELVARFPRARWIVPSRRFAEGLQPPSSATGADPGTSSGSVTCNIGCHTADAEGAREVVLLTDLLRILPPALQLAQLREALRVGQKAYLLCSGRVSAKLDDTPVRRELEGWPFTPLDQLAASAARAGITLTELTRQTSPLRVYALADRRSLGRTAGSV
jgi:GT2 family glycosyltransferase